MSSIVLFTVCQGCRPTLNLSPRQIWPSAQGSKEVLLGELSNFVAAWDNNHLLEN